MGYSDKQLKALGRDSLEELEAMFPSELEKVIVEANTSMEDVKAELEANPKYQDLKADLSAITQGKKEVDKRQKARIKYALDRLSEIGKLGISERMDWELQARKKRKELEDKKKKAAADKAKRDAEAAAEAQADNEDSQ